MPAEKNCHPINACNFVYDAFGVVTATDSRGRTTTVPPGPRNRGAYYDSATGEYLMGAQEATDVRAVEAVALFCYQVKK